MGKVRMLALPGTDLTFLCSAEHQVKAARFLLLKLQFITTEHFIAAFSTTDFKATKAKHLHDS